MRKVILLFFVALLARILFYFWGSHFMPHNLLKFKTADTVFYYDPLAQKLAADNTMEISLLSTTRFAFLGYLSLFYRYFGYRHWPVSIFHCFLGALSVVLLFLTARNFLKERTAFIIGLVAALQIVLIYWTPFINTETAFIFILSICLFLFSLFISSGKFSYIIPLSVFLLISSISRPLGMTFSVFMFLYLEWLILKKLFNNKGAVYFIVLNIALLICSGMLIIRSAQGIDRIIQQPYSKEALEMSLYLDEMPGREFGKNHIKVYGARLSLPPGMHIPKSKGMPQQLSAADVFSYFKNYYKKYLILTLCRAYTLFNPWVPQYSLRHNIFNAFFYGFIYTFSLIGLFEMRKLNRRFAALLLLALGSQVLLVSLTLVDYDFRFRLPTEFLLNIPVGVGIARLLPVIYTEKTVAKA